MKKLIALVLALAFMLLFSGCGNTENEENGISKNTADSTKPTAEQSMDSSIQNTDDPNSNQTKSVIVDDSLILVQSVDTLVKPYENFLWAEKYSEQGWLIGDGTSVSRIFPEVYNEIPQIIFYGDIFDIHYKDKVEFISLSVYNSDFERVYHNAGQEVLDDLTQGTYYLIITVKEQGAYIESEEKYEYSGYECVYKIVIADHISI